MAGQGEPARIAAEGGRTSREIIPPEAVAAVRAHPRFAEAARLSATGLVDFYAGNRLVNRLLNDRGRALFGFLALHLHHHADETGTGLTAARLMQVCEETELCSRGRTKALLALMRWAGYLAPMPGSSDRRQRPLAPTERMVSLHLERMRRQFTAIALVCPEGEEALARLHDPTFFAELMRAIGLTFRRGFRVLDYVPDLAPFAERDNGILLLFNLLVASEGGYAELSVSDLARRLHVSRAHVLQVLREAEEAGLIRREPIGPALVAILPRFESTCFDFFAATFAFMASCAATALAAQARRQALPEEQIAFAPGLPPATSPGEPPGARLE